MTTIIDITPRMPGPTEEEETVPLDTVSWRPEVVADHTGKWNANALRFATKDEAYRSARDLSYRWMAVTDFRAAPSDEPVNYRYTPEGKLEAVK